MTNLLGAWSLVECVSYKDDVGTPAFGEPPSGQIQYTDDGRMSGFLMDRAWVERGSSEAKGFTDFFAYAGTWERDGDLVRHHVQFSSQPPRVGTTFERRIEVLDDDTIVLHTIPEVSKTGHTYVTKLTWHRVGSNGSQ